MSALCLTLGKVGLQHLDHAGIHRRPEFLADGGFVERDGLPEAARDEQADGPRSHEAQQGDSRPSLPRSLYAGLRSRKGLALSPQSIGQMMRNTIYMGKVESPDFGVSTKGNFEPLVDEATFYRAQAVLDGRVVVAGPRQRHHPISRYADSSAAKAAAVRLRVAGRKAGTATTRTTTASVSAEP